MIVVPRVHRRRLRLTGALLVTAVAMVAVGASVAPVGSPAVAQPASMPEASICDPQFPDTCTLADLGAMLGIRIGSTAEPDEVGPGPYADTLRREFSSLTPENAMKWYSTNPAQGVYDFGPADAVVDFAVDADLEIRGHTIVWAQDTYTPAWVLALATGDQLAAVLAENVATVVPRYADVVDRWDVVNEPLATTGTDLSDSVFHRLLPADWMASLFSVTRALDPDAELWINEYGTDWVPGKHEALVALVTDLVASGAPIDGVGLQVHRPTVSGPDVAVLAEQMRDFTSLGLEVAVTELDVPIPPGDDAALVAQAEAYRRVVEACLEVEGCTEITVWGVTDADTWLDGLGVFPTPTRPLLFDGDFSPKPAYVAVRDTLAAAVLARQSGGGAPSPDGGSVAHASPRFTG